LRTELVARSKTLAFYVGPFGMIANVVPGRIDRPKVRHVDEARTMSADISLGDAKNGRLPHSRKEVPHAKPVRECGFPPRARTELL
jgi:hypothetical protein